MTRSVGFLFLGELHLIPHLLPIAAALSRRADAPAVTLHVATRTHEEVVRAGLAQVGLDRVAVRRVIGFRDGPPGRLETPRLPSKPFVLAANAARFLAHDVVVVAERTSLWLPMAARGRGARFVYNEHGAAPHANFASPRNRWATRILMPSEGMAARARAQGHADAPIRVVGYLKPEYAPLRPAGAARGLPAFAEARPTVIYVPHWKRNKSSWWQAGEAVLQWFAANDRYNLILAPHIRLPRFDPEFARRVAPYRDHPAIHVDATSYRLVDQSYIDAADLYLGDGSSQVVEWAQHPRPAVFLNPDRHRWDRDPRFSHWSMGEVIDDVADLPRALADAPARHAGFAATQRDYVRTMMGAIDGRAGERAAAAIAELL